MRLPHFWRPRFTITKVAILLILGALVNVLLAWWFATAPRNPLLLYPNSWREFYNHDSHPTNWDIWAESFPLHDTKFSAAPLDRDSADDGSKLGLLVQWGESRVGRSLANAQAIYNTEKLSLDSHTEIVISITNERIAEHLPSLPHARQLTTTPGWVTADDAVVQILPSFTALPEFMNGNFATPTAYESTVGWPARSLAMLQYFDASGNPQQRYMLQLPQSIINAIDSDAVLPLRPLPLGFAINTLFYAVLILIPWELLGWARRARRRRHGLCAHCAHSLEGLPKSAPCPECGTPPKPCRDPDNKPSV